MMRQTGDGFKDHFSTLANGYSRFRPGYPSDLFAWLTSVSPDTNLAWDCATGTGQAAVALAGRFQQVIASDASIEQIDKAEQHQSVEYRVSPAEDSGLNDASVDLITVAQAIHWFDQPAFMQEAARVLVPDGVLAVWTYNLFRITPLLDAIVDDLYWFLLKGYWDPERAQVENGYADLVMPFAELKPPAFHMEAHWDLEHLLGYLRTWSAVKSYREDTGVDPIALVSPGLAREWGEDGMKRKISWPLTLRAGINSSEGVE